MRCSLRDWELGCCPPPSSPYRRNQSQDAPQFPRNSSQHQIKDYGVGLLADLVDDSFFRKSIRFC
jgi:hypothetical protein